MDREFLQKVLAEHFAGNKSAMARALPMNLRHLQRMFAGTERIAPQDMEKITQYLASPQKDSQCTS